MSQTKRDWVPAEPRPLSNAEWDEMLAELAMMQLIEEYGPILQEEDEHQS